MLCLLVLLVLCSSYASRPEEHQRFLEMNRTRDPPRNHIMNILSHRSLGYLDDSTGNIYYSGEQGQPYTNYGSTQLTASSLIHFNRPQANQQYYALSQRASVCGHFLTGNEASKYHFDLVWGNPYATLDTVKDFLSGTWAILANGWPGQIILDFKAGIHGGQFDNQPLPNSVGAGNYEFFKNVNVLTYQNGYYLTFTRGNQVYLGIVDTFNKGIHGSYMDGNDGPYSFDAVKGTSAYALSDVSKFKGDVLVPIGYTGTLTLNSQGGGQINLGNEGSEGLSSVTVLYRYGAYYLYFLRSKWSQKYYALFENGEQGLAILALHGHFVDSAGVSHPFDAEGRASTWW
jgi:hypothetical protein